MQIIHTCQFWK